MVKQSANCSVTGFEKEDVNLSLPLFLGGEETLIEKDLSGLIDGLFVRDVNKKSVTRSVYGEKFAITNNIVGGNIYANLDSRTPGKDVTICPDDKQYSADSYEAAALNSSYFIHRVFEKVKLLKPELKLDPITLQVGTIITINEKSYESKGIHIHTKYMVDNALYDSELKSIIFVPHSPEMRQTGFLNHYWQVPMVAAHEYGHHIFNSLAPSKDSLRSIISDCFDSAAVYATPVVDIQVSQAGEVQVSDVMGSLNEGFSDLVAHYSLTEQERSVNWVPFLKKDREVTSAKFLMREDKTFSSKALRVFFSRRVSQAGQSPFEVNYQDIHVIGAIFAHQADKFLSEFTLQNDLKLKVLLEWAQKLGSTSMAGKTPRSALESGLEDFVRLSLTHLGRKYNLSTCRAIRDLYPFGDNTFPECQDNVE